MGRKALPKPGPFAAVAADAIRSELGSRSMSRRELARRAGMSEPYLRDRLNDEFPFSLNDIEAICAVFGEDPGEFLGALNVPVSPAPNNVTGIGSVRPLSSMTAAELKGLQSAAFKRSSKDPEQ